jgi:hypothetical protein
MFRAVASGFIIFAMLCSCRSGDKAPSGGGSSAATASPTSSKGTMRTYQLAISADASRPKVAVSIQLPASWSDAVGADGAPSFTAPGITGTVFGIAGVSTDAGEPAARIEKAFKWQYDDGAGVTRTPLPDGRLWASRVEGRITHARMFVPAPGGVVMGVAMLRAPTEAQLAEVRAAFETLAVAKE